MITLKGIGINELGVKVEAYVNKDGIICTYSIAQLIQLINSGLSVKYAVVKNNELLYNRPTSKINLTNQVINDWTVIEYLGGTPTTGNGRWLCKCKCGTYKAIAQSTLLDNKSKSCGKCGNRQRGVRDLTNEVFGHWKVDYYVSDYKWHCTCSCGNTGIVASSSLLDGRSTSCGHDTTGFKDIKGQTFGEWRALEYVGDSKWLCECSCTKKKVIELASLLLGKSLSCGHLKQGVYFDIYSNAVNLEQYLKKWQARHARLPYAIEVAQDLQISYSLLLKYLHSFKLESLINFNKGSQYETDLYDFLTSLGLNVERHNRQLITPQELDLYIPEKKIAIEFNGTYWHSSEQKADNYHITKTNLCAQKNIRLIHIFEHEYKSYEQKQKIHSYLSHIFLPQVKLYARDMQVKLVDSQIADLFLNTNHLQGSLNSTLAIGLYREDELIALMTFGPSRFNKTYTYELYRFCTKIGYTVTGGASKLFSYFVNNYMQSKETIVSYCNLAKFTGEVYLRMGFNLSRISKPNYIYVNKKGDVLSRYQCMKHLLIQQGYDANLTELEIMSQRNYFRVYDCGNAVYTYTKQ